MAEVMDPTVADGLGQVAAGLDSLLGSDLEPADSTQAIRFIKELEVLGRRLDAAKAELVDQIDRKALHWVDGHHSAKVMVRHVAQLSVAEAWARANTAKALRDLPETKRAFHAGEVGSCQVRGLARAHANRRVRDRLPEFEDRLLGFARRESYEFFDDVMGDWVRLADEDGTCDTNRRNHENRDARLVQNFDGSWSLEARAGSLIGAEMHTIPKRFIDAEFATDWEKAKIEYGDATTKADLDRTDAQRRADALFAIFERAASTEPGSKTPVVVTNVVIDHL